jgi:hypothetical protein
MRKFSTLTLTIVLAISGCSSTKNDDPYQVEVVDYNSKYKKSKQEQLNDMVVNDYSTYQKLNYEMIEKSNESKQLHLIEQQINALLIDVISNLRIGFTDTPIIVRNMNTNDVLEEYNSGVVLVENTVELRLRDFGFTVFDDRKPKGKLNGEELVLDLFLNQINGSNWLLTASVKQLDSNKMLASSRKYITGFFFKKMLDGVEVIEAVRMPQLAR